MASIITASNTTLKSLKPICTLHATCHGLLTILVRLLCVLVTLSFLSLATSAQASDKLSICYIATHSSLVPLAKLKDFYADEGLDVEVHSMPSGVQTMEAMFSGECTLATAADTIVAHYSLSRDDFFIISSVSVTTNLDRIVVRSDLGIHSAADLRGRRIAVPRFTIAHYFLDLYLAAHNLATQDVIEVFLPANEMASAFRRGEVDAVVHWEPNIEELAKEFGNKAKVLTTPGLSTNDMLLVGLRDTVRKNPATVMRVLSALLRAERYVKDQPADTKALMARNFNWSPNDIELVWPWHDFQITLDQPLMLIMEDPARWEISMLPLAQRPVLPNYLDFIYFDGLMALKPEAVTIIH